MNITKPSFFSFPNEIVNNIIEKFPHDALLSLPQLCKFTRQYFIDHPELIWNRYLPISWLAQEKRTVSVDITPFILSTENFEKRVDEIIDLFIRKVNDALQEGSVSARLSLVGDVAEQWALFSPINKVKKWQLDVSIKRYDPEKISQTVIMMQGKTCKPLTLSSNTWSMDYSHTATETASTKIKASGEQWLQTKAVLLFNAFKDQAEKMASSQEKAT
jgi:hypothetical protein